VDCGFADASPATFFKMAPPSCARVRVLTIPVRKYLVKAKNGGKRIQLPSTFGFESVVATAGDNQ
jgi:hypothetical protein